MVATKAAAWDSAADRPAPSNSLAVNVRKLAQLIRLRLVRGKKREKKRRLTDITPTNIFSGM